MIRFTIIATLILFLVALNSCFKGKKVDMIIHNARIHVMNEKMDVFEAIAIDDGKIVHIGPEREILNEFRSDKVINAGKKDIFPGFHDAHGHIMSLAKQMQSVDLRGMRSYREMITTLEKYRQKTNKEIIVGRGWDQSLWNEKSLPDNTLLNEVFPKIPVALTRIDGHAMLVNDAMLKWAGITDSTEIPGGVIQKRNGKITGILLDNAIDLVSHKLPAPNETDLKNAILAIQSQLFSLGITHVHEAGLDFNELQLFIDLSLNKELDLNIYAMLFPTDKNISFARQNGFYRTGNLSVRSFKIIADGSLGSHGACMIRPYSDSSTHGILLKEPKQIQEILRMANGLNYQVNTHCIGDSANRILLRTIDTLMKKKADHRWRIEHAQVIHPDDFKLFSSSGALPSVQPTHATTDYRWAEKHIGKKRLQGAYAYNTLYKQSGMILFGTDFPVESFDPFATIHAAVNRKNRENEPLNGFLPGEAVSVENTLKAMTVWAAYGCFEESSVGTLEKGKNANLVILDQPFNVGSAYLPNYAYLTMINGKVVFSMDSELME